MRLEWSSVLIATLMMHTSECMHTCSHMCLHACMHACTHTHTPWNLPSGTRC